MNLSFGFHGSDNVLRVARVFMAINRCTDRLRVLYTNLRTSTQPTPPSKFLWPNPTPCPSAPVNATRGLEFFSKVDRLLGTPINRTIIDEENKRHAMYLARMKSEDGTSTTDVFVKFTTKYNADAHRLLASHNSPSPRPYTPAHASSTTYLWSSCSTYRSLRASLFTRFQTLPSPFTQPAIALLRLSKKSAVTFPKPSKQSGGTFPRLWSYFTDRALFLATSGK